MRKDPGCFFRGSDPNPGISQRTDPDPGEINPDPQLR